MRLPLRSGLFFFLLTLAGLLLVQERVLAAYNLPGTADSAAGAGDDRNGLHRVAQDSNGYWYVVWETGTTTRILMAYTTTVTPTASTHWGLVTLVHSGATGIVGTPANDTNGSAPSIAIDQDDFLHFVWRAADTTGTCYYTQCSNLSALSTAANWSTPLRVSTDITDYSFALDYNGAPHLAGRGKNSNQVLYTKYDTATVAWLEEKALSTQVTTYTTADSDSVALAVDLDNNVYVAWRGAGSTAPTLTRTLYLLSSSNADAVAPTASSWLNLGQTSTAPNVVFTSCLALAPAMCADANGMVHLAWLNLGEYACANNGRIGSGLNGTGQIISDDGMDPKFRETIALMPTGTGRVYAFFSQKSPQTSLFIPLFDPPASFGTNASWSADFYADGQNEISDTVALLAPQVCTPPLRRRDLIYWFGYDAGSAKVTGASTWTPNGLPGAEAFVAGWIPPSQSKSRPHPHLNWVFPNTAVPLNTVIAPPTVAHTSKSAIYIAETAGGVRLYAVDSSTGSFARSYTTSAAVKSMVAATYSGNVHLYVATNGGKLLALIDNGTALALDPNWANNPKQVANATGNVLHSLAFNSESSTRYLYMMASVNTTHIGINKISADHGNDVTGFPAGTAYSPNGVESLLRVINDNVYVAGNTSQIYRRGADGTAEIFSSGITNAVRHLLLWRNTNDLYVSPDGNYVFRLTSGLLTNTWTSGRSASPGTGRPPGASSTSSRTCSFWEWATSSTRSTPPTEA